MYPFIWISIKHTGKGRGTTSETSSGIPLFRSSQTTLLHSLITTSRFTILVLWPNNTHRSHFYSSTVRVLSEYFNLFVLTEFVRSKVRASKAGYVSHCPELIFPHLTPHIQVGDTFKTQAYTIILLRGYGYPYVQFLILRLLAQTTTDLLLPQMRILWRPIPE